MMTKHKYLPLLIFQIILLALFYVFVKYGGENKANLRGYEDTHVMIFVGFGFLMTFLRRYSYSAVGLNWVLAALSVQWALLCQNFYHMKDKTIFVNKLTLVEADIMSATVLITFGALLGTASALQLLFIAIAEIAVATFNLYLISDVFKAADIGGSMAIHAFGAYFGLAASLVMSKKTAEPPSNRPTPTLNLNSASYVSDITAMIGSLFLFIFWPSFNAVLTVSDSEYERAITNTYLSLAASTVTTFVISAWVTHGKLDMVHVQNSTLAGGVAVGSVSNMFIGPGHAMTIGILAGLLSVLGFKYLTPALTKLGVRDTCGVHNLHGMPGIMSGICTIAFAALATKETYGADLKGVFGAMGGKGSRTAPTQAIYQLYALLATLAVAVIGGVITGLIAKLSVFEPLKRNYHYDDEVNWELP